MAGEGQGSGGAGVGGGTEGTALDVAGALADFTPPEGAEEGAEGKAEGTPEGEEGKVVEGAGGEGEKGKVPDAKEAEIAELKGQIAKLTEAISSLQKPPGEPQPKADEGKPIKYFEKPEDFEATFEKQENFEALIEKVSANTSNRAVQSMLKQLPTVVTNLVNTQVQLSRGIDKFYSENKDLADKRQFVGHVANDLMGKNPGWNLNKLFTELGKEVRQRLGVKPQAGKNPGGAPPRRTGTRLPAGREPQLEGLQGEIIDLLGDQGGIKR